MIRRIRPYTNGLRALFLCAAIAGGFGLGILLPMVAETPTHATAKQNGNGWKCNPGYLEIGAGCIADLSAPPDRSGYHPPSRACPGVDTPCLNAEIDGLKEIIEDLSLENAVLRSALADEVGSFE